MGETKVCPDCGIEKELSEFHNLSKIKCYKDSYCKACKLKRSRDWYYRIKKEKTDAYKRLLERNLQYTRNHKEKVKGWNKKRYIPHPREKREYTKETCKILTEHHEKLNDDPDRLTTEFMLSLIK